LTQIEIFGFKTNHLAILLQPCALVLALKNHLGRPQNQSEDASRRGIKILLLGLSNKKTGPRFVFKSHEKAFMLPIFLFFFIRE
jgi:hypothetical protein